MLLHSNGKKFKVDNKIINLLTFGKYMATLDGF